MNNKHLLVKSITLLYHESRLVSTNISSVDLIKKVLEIIKLPEVSLGLDREREITTNLIKTVQKLSDNIKQGPVSFPELNQQLIVDCGDDTSTVEAVRAGVEHKLTEDEANHFCANIRRELHGFLRDERAKELVFTFNNKLRFKPDEIESLPVALLELTAQLEPFTTGKIGEDPAVVASFGLDEGGKVQTVFEAIKERNAGIGGIRFGFQDINKMFGGYIDRGKMLVIGALQHQHKTGFSLALFRQILMYNIPVLTPVNGQYFVDTKPPQLNDTMVVDVEGKWIETTEETLSNPDLVMIPDDESKTQLEKACEDYYTIDLDKGEYISIKDSNGVDIPLAFVNEPWDGRVPIRRPAALRISTEDEIEDNMEQLYRNTYFSLNKSMPDMTLVTETEMVEYLQKHLGRNGWHAHFMRVNPSHWTYQSVCQAVADLESRGYDVQVVMVDYLPMIPTTGCEQGPTGHDLRDMYRRVRNYMSA